MGRRPDRRLPSAAAGELVRPVPTRGPYGPKRVNVRAQRRDKDSLLRWFEDLIRVLRECPEIGVVRPAWSTPLPRPVLVHRFDAPEGSILLLHNLSGRSVTIDLSGVDLGPDPSEVLADADYAPIGETVDQLEPGRVALSLDQGAARLLNEGPRPSSTTPGAAT